MTASDLTPKTGKLKIIFAGTPDFAAVALAALIKSSLPVSAVYTQPDRPSGRGYKLTAVPVKKLAEQHLLPVYQPVNFKDPDAISQLASLQPDVFVVAAYGIILPPEVLDIPTFGCINIHASLLPRWRGAAPIQRAIQAGDKETGITIMQMEAGLDTGPALLSRKTAITDRDTSTTLHDRLAGLGGEAIVETLDKLTELTPVPQDNTLATYAHRLSKAEGSIDWTLPATEIQRTIRAFTPWPGCFGRVNGNTVKIHQATVIAKEDSSATSIIPGTITECAATGIQVVCGKDSLRITHLQLPGAKAMSVKDFVNGNQHQLLRNQCFEALSR